MYVRKFDPNLPVFAAFLIVFYRFSGTDFLKKCSGPKTTENSFPAPGNRQANSFHGQNVCIGCEIFAFVLLLPYPKKNPVMIILDFSILICLQNWLMETHVGQQHLKKTLGRALNSIKVLFLSKNRAYVRHWLIYSVRETSFCPTRHMF